METFLHGVSHQLVMESSLKFSYQKSVGYILEMNITLASMSSGFRVANCFYTPIGEKQVYLFNIDDMDDA